MASITQIAIRSWTFLWTLLTMALVGNVIAEAFSGNPASVNYGMFVSAFSMLVLIYGFGAAFIESLAMPLVLLTLDGLATLFSVIAGIVFAANLGVHSCHNHSYLISNHMTNGGNNKTDRCRELQASCAFYWFMFVGFLASMVVSAMSGGSGRMNMRRGGVRRGGPSMSQV